MMPSHTATFTPDAVLSDALLVQRIAALSDKPALAAQEHLRAQPIIAAAVRPAGRGRGRTAERRASTTRASARRRRWAGALFQFARVAGILVIPALLLA